MRQIRARGVAVAVLAVAIYVAGVAAHAYVGEVLLNTSDERQWTVYGVLSFTVAGGSTSIGGVEIGEGDRVSLVVEYFDASSDSLRVWIGSTGWVNIDADGDGVKLLVNGVEVASGSWELSGIQASLDGLESTLTVRVEPEPEGWTHLEVDGETIINGVDSSEIVVVSVAPSETVSLNLNTGTGYLNAAAESVEVNGQEVPWFSGPGTLLVAAASVGAVLLARRRM